MLTAAPVAVSGLGVISAAGTTLYENIAALEQGKINASAPPFATVHSYPVFRCADTLPGVSLPSRYSRTVSLALCAALQALEHAGIAASEVPSLRVGIALGTSVGASLNFQKFYMDTKAGDSPPLDEIHQYLSSNPALALGELLQCTGPAQTVVNACSSGTDAIGLAAAWLREGICDLALAGGADELSPISYAGFSSLRLPSPEPCRPFDAKRSGLSLGEGAGFMLLETEHSRRKRSVKAISFIAGYGTATDAYHLTAPHPEGRGLQAAMDQAFAQAGAGFGNIAFINAHGTATQANDAAEGMFFSAHCPNVPFIATKGATGHTLGAAGAIEAVFTAAHLNAGILPPSPNFCETDLTMARAGQATGNSAPASPDPGSAMNSPEQKIRIAPVNKPTPVYGSLALSQSLAFGGNNSVLILAKGEA